jgi:hypothetical protein
VGGGWWAAGRLEDATRFRAAAVGGAAGALFVPALLAISFLASVAYRLVGPLGDALGDPGVVVGPPPALVVVGAFLWGVTGGVIGALAAERLGHGTGPGGGPGPNDSLVRR